MKVLEIIEFTKSIDEIFQSIAIDRHKFSRRIKELEIMGLIERRNDTVNLTRGGELVLEAAKWVKNAKKLSILDLDLPNDIWINSQVIKIIEIFKETEHIPDTWRFFLEERGLLRDNGINPAAEFIYDAYKSSTPMLYITEDLAEFLAGIPPGPSLIRTLIRYRNMYGYGQNIINAMEAMRLIVFSPPKETGISYILTEMGRKLKNMLAKMPIYRPVIIMDEKIKKALKGPYEALSRRDRVEIEYMGLYNVDKSTISDLGRETMDAYAALDLKKRKYLPIYILKEEFQILQKINEMLNISKTNPEVYPTESALKEKLVHISDLSLHLHLLEAKELIKRIEWKNKDAFELTKFGEVILSNFKTLEDDITTEAVKALTYYYSNDVPSPDWVIEAEKHKLVGEGGITKRGKALIEITSNIERKIFITKYDATILMKTPANKPITKQDLVSNILDYLKEEKANRQIVNIAISEAESKGYLEIYPNDVVKLTPIGKEIKIAIESAKTNTILGMKISVTPLIYSVLESIKRHEDEFSKVWREKEELTGPMYNTIHKDLKIPIETIKKAIVELRGMGFIGRKRGGRILTGAGEQLLKAGELLKKKIS